MAFRPDQITRVIYRHERICVHFLANLPATDKYSNAAAIIRGVFYLSLSFYTCNT